MLNKLTIRSRLIVLIGLMSLVSLAVGVVGLIQSSNGEHVHLTGSLAVASYPSAT